MATANYGNIRRKGNLLLDANSVGSEQLSSTGLPQPSSMLFNTTPRDGMDFNNLDSGQIKLLNFYSNSNFGGPWTVAILNP